MPGVANYLPARQAKFDQWLVNFSKQTSASPYAYGLTNTDAATIAQLAAQWSAAYQPVTSNATKTAQAVAAKDEARVIVTAQIRTFAQAIANNPGVAAWNKVGLRLNPRTSPWSGITAPTTRPTLSFQSATPLSAVLRYHDSDDGVSTKAKPYGVVQCQVFGQTSPRANHRPDLHAAHRHAHEIALHALLYRRTGRPDILPRRAVGNPHRPHRRGRR